MPIDYNLIKLIKNNYNSIDVSDESKDDVIADLQSTMTDELLNQIDEYEVKVGMPRFNTVVLKNHTIEIKNCVIKQERFKEKIYNLNSRTILFEKGSFDTGDYIGIQENGNLETYIVRGRIDRKITHDSAFLLHCQYGLNILDDDGVTIHNYALAFQDNKSRPGVSERADAGITENSQFQAYVRHDDISRRLIDVTGTTINGKSNRITRILIDGLAYRIVGSDPASMRGLITLGLELDTKSPNDNLELGVADYWSNVKAETPDEPELQIVGDNEICVGETNKFTIDTNNTVNWGLTNNGVNLTLGLTGVNGECTVTAKNDYKLIGKTETLTAYLDYGAEFSMVVKVVGFI